MIAVVDPHKITDCIVIGIATCRSPCGKYRRQRKKLEFPHKPIFIYNRYVEASYARKKEIHLFDFL